MHISLSDRRKFSQETAGNKMFAQQSFPIPITVCI